MTLQWKEVECPRCLAQPGESCRTKSGRKTVAHAVRHSRAMEDLRARIAKANQAAREQLYEPPMRTVHLPGDYPLPKITVRPKDAT